MTIYHSFRTRIGRRNSIPAAIALASMLVAIPHPPAAYGQAEATGMAPDPYPTMELSLDRARSLALANDEHVRQVTEAVAAARADALGARADKLPHLGLTGSYTGNLKKPAFFLPPDLAEGLGGSTKMEMGGDYDLQGAATLTLNLWTAGRLSAAAGAADEAVAAAEWQKALVQDAVVYGVEEAYFNVLLAAAQVEITEGAMEAAAEALRVTQAAFDQGTASRFDRLRAEVELANRESPLIQARNLHDLATMKLRRLCGIDPEAPVLLTNGLASVPSPDDLDLLMEEMISSSAELQSLRHQIGARKQAVRLAKAGRGPVVQLQGQYAVQGQWDDDLWPDSDETAGSASVALGVAIPIFDGFAAKADIGRTEAELRQTEVELERVIRDRELGVRQARIYLINALAALEGRREGVALAEESHRLALVRLENGLATPLERLDAELALIDAQTQLAGILHTCNVAQAALTLAVGTHEALPDGTQEVR